MPRIGLVHALHASLAPIEAAFAQGWPEAETVSLYDQSLYVDYERAGEITPEIRRRIETLLLYSAGCGADGVLFTGSLFGAPVEETRDSMTIPVLTAYEAMIEHAFAAGRRIGLLATVPDTVTMMRADIERYALTNELPYELDARLVGGALEALFAGDRSTHDGLIAAEAAAMHNCDSLMLGQFSMAPVLTQIPEAPGRRVLTSPDTAVAKLKRILSGT